MSHFKLFTGNYIQVNDALKLPESFYADIDAVKNTEQIEFDLNRIAYVVMDGTTSKMKDILLQSPSYTQGNFTGSPFFNTLFYLSPFAKNLMSQEITPEKKLLNFAYMDDSGVPCGFELGYTRDETQTHLAAHKRPWLFAVSIIKNSTAAPKDREITYVTHRALLIEDNEQGIDFNPLKLSALIAKKLNSKSVLQLLQGVVAQGNISITHINKLRKRIQINKNLDDRDPKLARLFDLFIMCARLSLDANKSKEKDALIHSLLNQLIVAQQNVNYFANKGREDIEQIVRFYTIHPLIIAAQPIAHEEELKQFLLSIFYKHQNTLTQTATGKFFNKNLYWLAITSVSLLINASLVLALSGAGTPAALTLIIGAAIISLAIKIGAKVIEKNQHLRNLKFFNAIYEDYKEQNKKALVENLDNTCSEAQEDCDLLPDSP